MNYSIIIDKDSSKNINSQLINIDKGSSSVQQHVVKNVKEIISPILEKYSCRVDAYFGDAYYRRELVKFKFIINPIDKHEEMLKELKEELIKYFKVKKLSYINDDTCMINIWM